jgi:hypothetical protein
VGRAAEGLDGAEPAPDGGVNPVRLWRRKRRTRDEKPDPFAQADELAKKALLHTPIYPNGHRGHGQDADEEALR